MTDRDDHRGHGVGAITKSLVDGGVVRTVRHFDEAESTNTIALSEQWPEASLPALVVASRQTSGRGRGGNVWISRPGDLTFSLVLSNDIAASVGPALPFAAGLGVIAAAESFGVRWPMLKWPNDVVLRAGPRLEKLDGVLVEASPAVVVVGVGVNRAAGRAATTETSLRDLSKNIPDHDACLTAVVRVIALELCNARDDADAFWDRVERRNALRGRTVRTDRGVGRVERIDRDGSLRVSIDDRIVGVRSGSVRLADSHDE